MGGNLGRTVRVSEWIFPAVPPSYKETHPQLVHFHVEEAGVDCPAMLLGRDLLTEEELHSLGSHATTCVIYFHSNGCDIGQCLEDMVNFRDGALGGDAVVLCPEYPGYGLLREYEPSVDAINLVARGAWRFCTDSTNGLGFQPRQIILWGRSIGSGPAMHLAHELARETVRRDEEEANLDLAPPLALASRHKALGSTVASFTALESPRKPAPNEGDPQPLAEEEDNGDFCTALADCTAARLTTVALGAAGADAGAGPEVSAEQRLAEVEASLGAHCDACFDSDMDRDEALPDAPATPAAVQALHEQTPPRSSRAEGAPQNRLLGWQAEAPRGPGAAFAAAGGSRPAPLSRRCSPRGGRAAAADACEELPAERPPADGPRSPGWFSGEGRIMSGMQVIVMEDVRSDSSSRAALQRGERGVVLRVDEKGDALIDFQKLTKSQWIFSRNLLKLRFRKARRALAAVVLLAPLTSVDAVIRHHVPSHVAATLVGPMWEVLEMAKDEAMRNVPLLVVHPKQDEIVPRTHGETIFEQSASASKFGVWLCNATHNIALDEEHLRIARSFLYEVREGANGCSPQASPRGRPGGFGEYFGFGGWGGGGGAGAGLDSPKAAEAVAAEAVAGSGTTAAPSCAGETEESMQSVAGHLMNLGMRGKAEETIVLSL